MLAGKTDTIRLLSNRNQDQVIGKLQDSIANIERRETQLVPKTNMELSGKDLHAVNQHLAGMELSKLVDHVFAKNPKNIAHEYETQKRNYEKLLVRLNRNCFSSKGICQCDSISHIPGFRAP